MALTLYQLQTGIEELEEWQRVAIANVAKRHLEQHDAEALIAKIERAVAQKINELIHLVR